jgi:hypothetical protein
VGPGTNPPAGCISAAQLISVAVTDLYNPSKAVGASYSCVFYYNTGSPASFAALGQGVSITGGTWVQGPAGVQASSSGVCAPSNWTPWTGVQVVVKICIDGSATCAAGDYTNQKTVAYCPLPSSAPTSINLSCNPGPGWGSVPFTTLAATTATTASSTAPIVMIAGQNPTGSNSGYNSATPTLLDERYQNGTDFTSANTCWLFSQSATTACDLPKASSLGRFTMTWGLTQGGAGTAPANPAGSGYMTVTPVDLQSGTLARGALQLVLSVEIKATTNNDMCAITSPTIFGATPVVVQKGSSGTDTFYLYVLNEASLTTVTDPYGNAINFGSLSASVQLNCGAVYNGSGDVVTITPIVYGYYSINYVKTSTANTLNPEASALSQTAVITVKT